MSPRVIISSIIHSASERTCWQDRFIKGGGFGRLVSVAGLRDEEIIFGVQLKAAASLNALPGCERRWKMLNSARSRVLIERTKIGKDLLPLCRHIGMNCEGSWPAADGVSET